MGLLDFLKRKDPQQAPAKLFGEWKGRVAQEDVSIKFLEDGRLIYIVHQKDRKQIMNLTFRVEGNYLITDQHSSPRRERTRFSFDPDGNLMLDYDGTECGFARV